MSLICCPSYQVRGPRHDCRCKSRHDCRCQQEFPVVVRDQDSATPPPLFSFTKSDGHVDILMPDPYFMVWETSHATCLYIHVRMPTHLPASTRMSTHTSAHMPTQVVEPYIQTHSHVYAYTYAYAFIDTYVYTHASTHMRLHTYIYT